MTRLRRYVTSGSLVVAAALLLPIPNQIPQENHRQDTEKAVAHSESASGSKTQGAGSVRTAEGLGPQSPLVGTQIRERSGLDSALVECNNDVAAFISDPSARGLVFRFVLPAMLFGISLLVLAATHRHLALAISLALSALVLLVLSGVVWWAFWVPAGPQVGRLERWVDVAVLIQGVVGVVTLAAVLWAMINYAQVVGDQRKAKQYQAWQVINAARGLSGDGGRRIAIQDLHADGASLVGVDLLLSYG
jgi:hypothetical protein